MTEFCNFFGGDCWVLFSLNVVCYLGVEYLESDGLRLIREVSTVPLTPRQLSRPTPGAPTLSLATDCYYFLYHIVRVFFFGVLLRWQKCVFTIYVSFMRPCLVLSESTTTASSVYASGANSPLTTSPQC